MRTFRSDNPASNPRLRYDGQLPKQGRRVVVSNTPDPVKRDSPRPTALTTTQPQPKRDPVRDAKDVTNAKRDEAIAQIRKQFKGSEK